MNSRVHSSGLFTFHVFTAALTLRMTTSSLVPSCPSMSLPLQPPGHPTLGLFLPWFSFFLHPMQAFSKGHALELEAPSSPSPFWPSAGMGRTRTPAHPCLHTSCGLVVLDLDVPGQQWSGAFTSNLLYHYTHGLNFLPHLFFLLYVRAVFIIVTYIASKQCHHWLFSVPYSMHAVSQPVDWLPLGVSLLFLSYVSLFL